MPHSFHSILVVPRLVSASQARARTILLALALVLTMLAACAGPVIMKVGETTIDGLVIDRESHSPIADACVTELLAKGGFWTQPGKYLIGYACTDSDGTFRIPANPRRVLNAAEPDSHPYFSVSANGYRNSWFIPNPETLAGGKVTISLVRSADNRVK